MAQSNEMTGGEALVRMLQAHDGGKMLGKGGFPLLPSSAEGRPLRLWGGMIRWIVLLGCWGGFVVVHSVSVGIRVQTSRVDVDFERNLATVPEEQDKRTLYQTPPAHAAVVYAARAIQLCSSFLLNVMGGCGAVLCCCAVLWSTDHRDARSCSTSRSSSNTMN